MVPVLQTAGPIRHRAGPEQRHSDWEHRQWEELVVVTDVWGRQGSLRGSRFLGCSVKEATRQLKAT